jgi:hypothetical protein
MFEIWMNTMSNMNSRLLRKVIHLPIMLQICCMREILNVVELIIIRVTQMLKNWFLPNRVLRIPILYHRRIATFPNDRGPFTKLLLKPKIILTFLDWATIAPYARNQLQIIQPETHCLWSDMKLKTPTRQKTDLEVSGLATQTRLQDEGNQFFIEMNSRSTNRRNQEEACNRRRRSDGRTKMSMDLCLQPKTQREV